MSTVLLNSLISIASGVLVAVLSELVLDLVRKRSNRPKLKKNWFLPLTVVLVTIAVFGLLSFRYVTKASIGVVNPYLERLRPSGHLVALLERSIREFETITGTDYNQVLLAITSGDSRQLVTVADSVSYCKSGYHKASLHGLIGSCFATGRTINAKDVSEYKEYIPAVPETKSELVVPIVSDGAVVIGVLNSESEFIQHFDSDMERDAKQLAAALAELLPSQGWNGIMKEEQAPSVSRYPQNTWKLNLTTSTFDPGAAPKSATRTDGWEKVFTKTVNADGTITTTEHLTSCNGTDVPYSGNPRFDTIAVMRMDANTRELTIKKAGKVVLTARSVLSADGKVDTVTTLTGTNASGRPIHMVQVWEKQ